MHNNIIIPAKYYYFNINNININNNNFQNIYK